ncbi:response regulator [Flavobacterium sp. Sd200]|uniref:response regulator n=1 Tax=Flavobacterium sp. Sd200 TaxID=2692211 RepID=UPI001EFF7D98|nr:response regulator [Flavobacterium sp. Sd200]
MADEHKDVQFSFKKVFKEIRVKHELNVFKDCHQLMAYLMETKVVPHLVFLDVNMPERSVLQCIKEIRAVKKLQNLVIAIYNTLSNNDDEENTFIAGANIYIKKPASFTAFKKIMEEVLSLSWLYTTDGFNRDNFILSY